MRLLGSIMPEPIIEALMGVKLPRNEKLRRCVGCEDDFYNGNNPVGVDMCWMFPDAKLVKRKQVHMNQVPPWTQEPQLFLSCYRKKSFIFVEPDRTN